MSEEKNQDQTEHPPISVYDLIFFSIDQFASVAWQKMGLQPDPMSGKIVKDLEQAKKAIDIVENFIKDMDEKLNEDDKRKLNALISDLKLNYIRQAQTKGDT